MTKSGKASRPPTRKMRCAIYTRKSSEEGLDQAFNSLDAQREACVAFILSQKHEGWTVLTTFYDDGGFSGGTVDRPALQRLLSDIREGKIDVVVVYKIDRLTRSLFDFAKIVEAFDAKGVSFVSITQQFNTTTSIGLLTLNVLLSSPNSSERWPANASATRSPLPKRRACGWAACPHLAMTCKTESWSSTRRKLAPSFISSGDMSDSDRCERCRQSLMARGSGASGGHWQTALLLVVRSFPRGALYLMLQNRIYRGEITHKGNVYPAEHQPIVDKDLWNEVQAILAENRVERATGANTKQPSLLAGLIFDETGERLTPSHAVKKGTRYRYYVSRSLIVGTRKDKLTGRRIPAGNLEILVITRLRSFLADEGAVLNVIGEEHAMGLHRAS